MACDLGSPRAADPGTLTGFRIIVAATRSCCPAQALEELGATVVRLTLANPGATSCALDAIAARAVDAVVFTSAAAGLALTGAARDAGRLEAFVAALRNGVVPFALRPAAADPLRVIGVDPLLPHRFRLPTMTAALTEHLADTHIREVRTDGGVVWLSGQVATLDGEPLALSPTALAILRALARHPGEVLDRHRLLAALPGSGDVHAVEVAVARLRGRIRRRGVVQTVVKRGYRLAVAENGDHVDC